jgi:hypothetical protein
VRTRHGGSTAMLSEIVGICQVNVPILLLSLCWDDIVGDTLITGFAA